MRLTKAHITPLVFVDLLYSFWIWTPLSNPEVGSFQEKKFQQEKKPKKGSQRLEIVATLVEDISLLYVVVTNTVEDISMFSITKFLNPYCFHKFILL